MKQNKSETETCLFPVNLDHTNSFLLVSEGAELKIKMLNHLVPGEDSLSGLYPHMSERPVGVGVE